MLSLFIYRHICASRKRARLVERTCRDDTRFYRNLHRVHDNIFLPFYFRRVPPPHGEIWNHLRETRYPTCYCLDWSDWLYDW